MGFVLGAGLDVALPGTVYVQVIVTGPPASNPISTPVFSSTVAIARLELLHFISVAPASGGVSVLVSPFLMVIFASAIRRNFPL